MEWTWDVSQWELIQHLAVWPLATLVAGITICMVLMSITDPTFLPDEAGEKSKAVEAGKSAASRHRA